MPWPRPIALCHRRDSCRHARPHRFQHRQDVPTKASPLCRDIGVAWIVAPVHSGRRAQSPRVVTRDREHWPDQVHVAIEMSPWRHAGKTGWSGPATEGGDDGLQLILGMMTGGDQRGTTITGGLDERFVSNPSGLGRRRTGHLHMPDFGGNVQPSRDLDHVVRLRIRLRTQMMVDMRLWGGSRNHPVPGERPPRSAEPASPCRH